MPLDIKSRETFIKEITGIKNETGCSTLDAIIHYSTLYDVSEEEIAEKLLSSSIKESLEEECNSLNLLKKENKKNCNLNFF